MIRHFDCLLGAVIGWAVCAFLAYRAGMRSGVRRGLASTFAANLRDIRDSQRERDGVPMWDIKGTELGKRFEAHVRDANEGGK